ncbi:MAG: hypothetical protein GQ525_10795, partial [Draconibacterium sp.]|nr:hypothetical protein [Draconibacterium sp.]
EMDGRVFGEWKYNKKAKSVTIKSEMIKEFAGERKVSKHNRNELVLSGTKTKLFFIKLDNEKIKTDNKNSNLEGSWKIITESGFKILTFELPDLLSIKEDFGGGSSSSAGTWIYNSTDKSLLIMANDNNLRGLNKVVKQTNNELNLENKGNIIKINKLEKSNIIIERLSFSEEDFYDETGDYKYYDEEGKLPWNDYYKIITNMDKVKQLVYNYSTLIAGTKTFDTKKLSANISANIDAGVMSFDNIFIGLDSKNIPEDYEMQVAQFSSEKRLFPFESDTYRIVGNEEITTPAGTFNCTVIEAIGDYDENLKLWMIIDSPGILAKVVRDESGDFGHFIVFELTQIISK